MKTCALHLNEEIAIPFAIAHLDCLHCGGLLAAVCCHGERLGKGLCGGCGGNFTLFPNPRLPVARCASCLVRDTAAVQVELELAAVRLAKRHTYSPTVACPVCYNSREFDFNYFCKLPPNTPSF